MNNAVWKKYPHYTKLYDGKTIFLNLVRDENTNGFLNKSYLYKNDFSFIFFKYLLF